MTSAIPYPTLSDVDLSGKRVLLRAGFDVPIEDGNVTDTSRIDALVPTMKQILDAGASLIIIAHQGRPKVDRDPAMSQKPLVAVLTKVLGVHVKFSDFCRGEAVQAAAKALQPGEVLLLENLRFEAEEKSKDANERDAFGKELASLADVYVNDAFTNCHRDHASMTSIPKYIPGVIGLQLEKEIRHLQTVLEDPRHPVTLIISGAKMETKVPVIEYFLDKGDDVLLGGLIANTFLVARGFDIGASKFEKEWVEKAQEIMLMSEKVELANVHVPRDVLVADSPEPGAPVLDIPAEDVEGELCVFDVGSVTAKRYKEILEKSGTIIWNGPLGMYEVEHFASASKDIAEAVAAASQRGATTIIGGGDTVDFHIRYGISMQPYTWVSMGGGAMLEFISGQELPGLTVLKR